MSFQHPVGRRNRGRILRAILELGNSYPVEIKEFLDDEARKSVVNNYNFEALSAKEKTDLVKKETISERTLFEWLRKLDKEGLLIHEDNKYRLSNQAASEVDLVSQLFGMSLLVNTLVKPIDPNSGNGIMEAINSFGIFIIYLLLYCLQPLKNIPQKMNRKQLENFRLQWAYNVISPEYMLMILRDRLGLTSNISTTPRPRMEFRELTKEQYEGVIHCLRANYPDILKRIDRGVEEMNDIIPKKLQKTRGPFFD